MTTDQIQFQQELKNLKQQLEDLKQQTTPEVWEEAVKNSDILEVDYVEELEKLLTAVKRHKSRHVKKDVLAVIKEHVDIHVCVDPSVELSWY
jgi:hypothetical protein